MDGEPANRSTEEEGISQGGRDFGPEVCGGSKEDRRWTDGTAAAGREDCSLHEEVSRLTQRLALAEDEVQKLRAELAEERKRLPRTAEMSLVLSPRTVSNPSRARPPSMRARKSQCSHPFGVDTISPPAPMTRAHIPHARTHRSGAMTWSCFGSGCCRHSWRSKSAMLRSLACTRCCWTSDRSSKTRCRSWRWARASLHTHTNLTPARSLFPLRMCAVTVTQTCVVHMQVREQVASIIEEAREDARLIRFQALAQSAQCLGEGTLEVDPVLTDAHRTELMAALSDAGRGGGCAEEDRGWLWRVNADAARPVKQDEGCKGKGGGGGGGGRSRYWYVVAVGAVVMAPLLYLWLRPAGTLCPFRACSICLCHDASGHACAHALVDARLVLLLHKHSRDVNSSPVHRQ